MTAEATFKSLRCFADVPSTTTPGFSRNNRYQIWAISVRVFVDFDAVSITIDGGCDSWLTGVDPVFRVRGGEIRRGGMGPSQVKGESLVGGPGDEAPPPRKLLQLSDFRAKNMAFSCQIYLPKSLP